MITIQAKTQQQDLVDETFSVMESINDEIDNNFWNDKAISEEIQKEMEDNYYLYKLEFVSDGTDCILNFLDTQIWCSEDDDRPYNEELDQVDVTLENWIKQKMIRILTIHLRLIERYITL